jgi:peptidoglycan/LPS O-acetylase OafA/YrhL
VSTEAPLEPAVTEVVVAEPVADTARTHVGALDGLRAIAAVVVIALHVGIYSGQVASSWLGIPAAGPLGVVVSRFTVGVPIFFVLSGLLLYRPWADAAVRGRPRPGARPYLWHRALRILPAYWLVALVAVALFTPDRFGQAWPLARTLLLLTVYQPDALPLGLTQTWSLATEVAFYLVLPTVAVVLHRLVRGGASLVPALVALGGLELVTLVSTVLVHRPAAGAYPLAQLWLPTYLGYFAAGTALALIAARISAQVDAGGTPPAWVGAVRRHPWWSWGVALAAYVLVSTPLSGTTARYPTVGEALLEHVLYLVTAVALVLPLLLAPSAGPARVTGSAVLRFLGRISYGLFLWHMVVVEAWLRITGEQAGQARFGVLFPVTLAITVLLSWVSFRLLEQPLRRLRPLVGGRS